MTTAPKLPVNSHSKPQSRRTLHKLAVAVHQENEEMRAQIQVLVPFARDLLKIVGQVHKVACEGAFDCRNAGLLIAKTKAMKRQDKRFMQIANLLGPYMREDPPTEQEIKDAANSGIDAGKPEPTYPPVLRVEGGDKVPAQGQGEPERAGP